jgi:hypothetical protein
MVMFPYGIISSRMLIVLSGIVIAVRGNDQAACMGNKSTAWKTSKLGPVSLVTDESYYERSNMVCRKPHSCIEYTKTEFVIKNGFTPRPSNLKGGTIWINEWVVTGHMFLDIYVIEVLQNFNINRIVLQREKQWIHGDFHLFTFYDFYYQVAFKAANITVPVYERKGPNLFAPYYVGGKNSNISSSNNSSVHRLLKEKRFCFDVLFYRQPTADWSLISIGRVAVEKFKSASHALLYEKMAIKNQHIVPTHLGKQLTISVIYRGNTTRAMTLKSALSLTEAIRNTTSQFGNRFAITVRMLSTGHFSAGNLTASEAALYMSQSDVVVATHGAFLSNAIYMPDDGLLIEMVGLYAVARNKEMYRRLANLFFVNHRYVNVQDLKSHKQAAHFTISPSELKSITCIVTSFVEQRAAI